MTNSTLFSRTVRCCLRISEHALLLGLLMTAFASGASAQTTIGGTTDLETTSPSYTRPDTGCSGLGESVRYTTVEFYVDTTGNYTFQTSGNVGASYGSSQPGHVSDPYLVVYRSPFDPIAYTTNCLGADDDSPGSFESILTLSLSQGTIYTAIITTYSTGLTGLIGWTGSGVGNMHYVISVQSAATSSPTNTGGTLTVQLSNPDSADWVAVPSAAAAPTKDQIVAGNNAAGTAAQAHGSFAVATALTNASTTLTGLSAGTAYKIYVVADNSGTGSGVRFATLTTTGTSFALSPATISLAPLDSTTFAATGGSGSGYVYSIGNNQSGGTINSSTGFYRAGAAGGVADTVVVTDSAMNMSSSTVTVTAGVSLTPSSPSLAYAGTQTFAAHGGNGLYSYALSTNNSHGSVDANTGAYASGHTGGVADIVTATDTLGNFGSVTITVAPPPAMALSGASLPPMGSTTFAATGGEGHFSAYTYSLLTNLSGGTIDAMSGVYVAGATGSVTDVVQAADGAGNMVSASVSVTAAVSLTPANGTINYGDSESFMPQGGNNMGFTFALATNNSMGSIDLNTGVYTPGLRGNVTDVVRVTDSLHNTTTTNVSVGVSTLSIDPVDPTLAPHQPRSFTASGGSGTGYTFSISANNSTGLIDASSGFYIAGATGSVTDTVEVTDSVGNTLTTHVTVTAGVTLSPTTSMVAPNGSETLTATGGSVTGMHYYFSVNNSGGTIGNTSGVYTAGSTGNVMDTLMAIDSRGNFANASVTVGPALSASVDQPQVPPRGSDTFRASLGSGMGYGFQLSVNASGATIDANSGAYLAGNTGNVIDVIRATDSLGNIASIGVAVTRAVSLTPTSAQVVPSGTASFAAIGGSGAGFVFSLPTRASGGSIDVSTGAYSAGRTSDVTDVVQVADSLGNVATANVGVGVGVALTPASASLAPRAPQRFSAVGGSSMGFQFALLTNHSGASIDAASGAYVAGSVGGVNDTVGVADSLGNMASATINVGPVVSLTPSSITLAPLGLLTFNVTGGSGTGYRFSLSSSGSGGSIDAQLGAYAAGAMGNSSDTVLVTDSLGNRASATINVSDALVVMPTAKTLPPRGTQTFVATAGAGSYAFALTANGSGGSVNSSTGVYTAGSTPSSSDTVTVSDGNGATVVALVSVGTGITMTADTTSVAPVGVVHFAANGGSGSGFVFAVSTNRSGAQINASTGRYVAGSGDGVSDVVTVTDSLGNTASTSIAIGAGVALNPPTPSVAPRGAQTFAANGGSGTGFTFSLLTNGSGGTIDASSGAYRAGSMGGTSDVVRAIDSLGNFATATVSVGASVALSPTTLTLPPNAIGVFTVSGGSGTAYVFSVATNGSGGHIDANGTYTAGAMASTSDIVHVVDSLGNSANATVTISAGIVLNPASASVAPRGSVMLSAIGGSGTGYSFVIRTNGSGGNVVAATGAYTAGSTANSQDVITVTDSLGNTANAGIAVGDGIHIHPDAPSLATRGTLMLSATGGSGTGYSYTLAQDQSGGTIDATSGAYTAGSTNNVTDLVTVTDSFGNTASLSIAVGDALNANPPSASVPPRGTQMIAASGGSGSDYTFVISTNGSGGTIDSSGAYTAGDKGGGTDIITVSDALGNHATVTIQVGPNVSVTPDNLAVAPHGSVMFAAVGGKGGYTFALTTNASSGTIDESSGNYQAGDIGDVSDVVTVTDALGNSTEVTVAVGTALTLAASNTTLPRGRLTLMAAGGAVPYSYAFTTNASGAMLDADSGAYTAGSTGRVDDIVKVTDANGVTGTTKISVGPGITISPTPDEVMLQTTEQFTATGGSGEGYAWALLPDNAGSIDPASGLYTPSTKLPDGDVTIEVTDSLGNTARVMFPLKAAAAVATVTGAGGGGCSCNTMPLGSGNDTWPALLSMLAVVGCMMRTLRKRR